VFIGQVVPGESLFTYPAGIGVAEYAHPEHTPTFLSDIVDQVDPVLLAACRDNKECIFDASQTGDVNIGLETMAMDSSNRDNLAILSQSMYCVSCDNTTPPQAIILPVSREIGS